MLIRSINHWFTSFYQLLRHFMISFHFMVPEKLSLKVQEGQFYIPYLAIADLIATFVTSSFLLLLDIREALYFHQTCFVVFYSFLTGHVYKNPFVCCL